MPMDGMDIEDAFECLRGPEGTKEISLPCWGRRGGDLHAQVTVKLAREDEGGTRELLVDLSRKYEIMEDIIFH